MDYSDVLIRIPRTSVSEENGDDAGEIAEHLDLPEGVGNSLLNTDVNRSTRSLHRRTVLINGVQTELPDVNAYQQKKTLAEGMMDLSLLSANANQLRYVLDSYKSHLYFCPSVVFIIISIVLQVAVGVGLILNGRYNIKFDKDRYNANKINNYTVIGIFIVTVVNVFVSAFGIVEDSV